MAGRATAMLTTPPHSDGDDGDDDDGAATFTCLKTATITSVHPKGLSAIAKMTDGTSVLVPGSVVQPPGGPYVQLSVGDTLVLTVAERPEHAKGQFRHVALAGGVLPDKRARTMTPKATAAAAAAAVAAAAAAAKLVATAAKLTTRRQRRPSRPSWRWRSSWPPRLWWSS